MHLHKEMRECLALYDEVLSYIRICDNYVLYMYFIQQCFICRPSDSTLSEAAGIKPRNVATWHWQSDPIKNHSVRSNPRPGIDLIRTRARSHPHPAIDLIHTRL